MPIEPTSSATPTRASRRPSRTARSCSGPLISWSRGWCSAHSWWVRGRGTSISGTNTSTRSTPSRRRSSEPGRWESSGPTCSGPARSFELEVFESPGGYICGEQSALIEAIEEHRAEPRNRPPVIEANGLYNQPTLLNNVETFAWVPSIVLNGGAWYRDSGLADTPWYVARRKPDDKPERWPRGKGLRFFSICGDVARPGVFEVPIGLTVGELIAMAGGMRDGLPLLALAPSGPSGGLLPAMLTPADLPAKRRRNFPAGRTELSHPRAAAGQGRVR